MTDFSLLLQSYAHTSNNGIIVNTLIVAVAVFASAYILEGVEVKNFVVALVTAICISFFNATLGRVLDFFAFPLSILTLGLFRFVVDAVIILIADYLLKGFRVKNFIWAIVMAVCIAVISGVLERVYPG